VYGPEPFEDRNGNGTYDGAEPFTDTNGNGIRDEGEPLIVLPWIGKPTKEYTLNEVNDSYTGLQQGDEIYRPEFDSKYDILAQQARARAEVIASGAVIDGNMAKKGDNMEVVLNAAQCPIP
jgi:hypothetical protein